MDLSIFIHNMHRPVLLYYLSSNTCHSCPGNISFNQYAHYAYARNSSLPHITQLSWKYIIQSIDMHIMYRPVLLQDQGIKLKVLGNNFTWNQSINHEHTGKVSTSATVQCSICHSCSECKPIKCLISKSINEIIK